MKTPYQHPETKVVKIQLSRFITTSPPGFSSPLDKTGDNGSKALGRRGFWDDGEE